MESKYWILIIIVLIVCSIVGIILTTSNEPSHGNVIKICPACKTCPTCEDCQEKIDYCFEECKYGFPIVGWEDKWRSCLWNCFHHYNIEKIEVVEIK